MMQKNFKKFDFINDIYCRDEAQVIEKDKRKIVSDNQVHLHPYNAIGKIKSSMYCHKTQDYKVQQATGTLIGMNLILTSAHIFYFSNQQCIADSIKFFPISYSTNQSNYLTNQQNYTPTQQISQKGIPIKRIYCNFNFFNQNSRDSYKNDFAFLQLENNSIIKKDQYLSLKFDYDFQKQKGKKIMISGYGSQFNNYSSNFQLYQQNFCERETQGFLYYKHTTSPGTSGAPILLKQENNYKVIGIHKGSRHFYNYGLSLSLIKSQFPQTFKLSNNQIKFQNLKQNWQQSFIKTFKDQKINNLKLKKQFQDLNQKYLTLQQQNRIQRQKIQDLQKQLYSLVNLKLQCQKQLYEIKQKIKQNLQLLCKNCQQNILPKQKKYLTDKDKDLQLLYQTIKDISNDCKIKTLVSQFYKENSKLSKAGYGKLVESKYFQNKASFQRFKKKYNIQLCKDGYFLSFQKYTLDTKNLDKILNQASYNHIEQLTLAYGCNLDDKSWKKLSSYANKFHNLKILYILDNSIKTIQKEDILGFKSLKFLDLEGNPLTQQTVRQLKILKKERPQIFIGLRLDGKRQQWPCIFNK